jgi:hypothetical protein
VLKLKFLKKFLPCYTVGKEPEPEPELHQNFSQEPHKMMRLRNTEKMNLEPSEPEPHRVTAPQHCFLVLQTGLASSFSL